MRRYLIAVAGSIALLAATELHAAFTIDETEAQLRGTYAHIQRVSDLLPAGVNAHENITYAKVEHAPDLQLDLYRPATQKVLPAVVLIHGGGWDSGSRQMERPFAKQLAARGYVAVTISYRLGEAGRFPVALQDVTAAVRWLRVHASEYHLDQERIGVLGVSAGGQLAALLGAGNAGGPDDVQVVVDVDGLADFTTPEFVAEQAAKPSAPTRFLGGSYRERSAVWKAASALAQVGAHSAPTLFVNSTSPTPMLPGRPEMHDRLNALGIDSKIVVIPNTPHPFWLFEPWFTPTLSYADEFLAKHLK